MGSREWFDLAALEMVFGLRGERKGKTVLPTERGFSEQLGIFYDLDASGFFKSFTIYHLG